MACAGLVTAALPPVEARPSVQPPTSDLVWTTRVKCSAPTRVRVAVMYNATAPYRGVLSLCRVDRSALPTDFQPEPARFSFLGVPKDIAVATRLDRARQIDGRIWEVSAEPGFVRLGLSFSASGEILLNETHDLSPTAPARHALSIAVTIETEPPVPVRP